MQNLKEIGGHDLGTITMPVIMGAGFTLFSLVALAMSYEGSSWDSIGLLLFFAFGVMILYRRRC